MGKLLIKRNEKALCLIISIWLIVTCMITASANQQANDYTAPSQPVVPVTPGMENETDVIGPMQYTDTNIFKRTPKIDGRIQDGEWDLFYSKENGDLKGDVFLNWDSTNIYSGIKADKPCNIQIYLDTNGDGWLHGDDNIEILITADKKSPYVGRYDSKNSKSISTTQVTDTESSMVEIVSDSGSFYNTEIKIPWLLLRNPKIRAGKKIGIGINLSLPNQEKTSSLEPEPGIIQNCTLVTKKIAALKPFEIGFDLRDTKIAQGDELLAKFHVLNTDTSTADAHHFIIAGEGNSGEYLSSMKIRLDGIAPKKRLSQEYSTIIPMDMPLGCLERN